MGGGSKTPELNNKEQANNQEKLQKCALTALIIKSSDVVLGIALKKPLIPHLTFHYIR